MERGWVERGQGSGTVERKSFPLAEKPMKCCRRQYKPELSDKHAGKSVLRQLSDDLARIDQKPDFRRA